MQWSKGRASASADWLRPLRKDELADVVTPNDANQIASESAFVTANNSQRVKAQVAARKAGFVQIRAVEKAASR